ncbi:MAG: AarF/ABC1/UbiB kinase family protein [Propionibacteriaceae bacterium]|jgi:predicted unusual protein kinase regulating ubiquinone biosynthesis (AarF/ABC1/UbiB family)|nr:AarF/ABC1/UbiB kinase family protein [Propionibacteriaceae bacterium]
MRQADRGRYRATVSLAVRYAIELWTLNKTRHFRSPEAQQRKLRETYTRQAREFTEFAKQMGGLIIKLGQFLSVRIDALPKEYIDELGKLQDEIPPADSATMIGVVEAELGQPITSAYASFEPEPIAAASLGQVHRAQLPTGEDVAVKILRPGIEELIDVDVRSLRTIMRLLDRFMRIGRYMDVEAFCQDFEDTVRDELDYLKEGKNAETFQRNFLTNMHVEMPKIHWSHTSRRVLTMEFMDGTKINELDALDALGVDRHQVAVNLFEIYLQMLLGDGFFHADPHPGNIFVRPDGIIQLIDFGQVGQIDEAMRQGFASAITALLSGDGAGVVDSLKQLGFLAPQADTRLIERAVMPMIETMMGDLGNMFAGESFLDTVMQGRSLESFNIDADLLDAMREFILTQPISLPGNVTFLGKALITVIADVYKLDPQVDILAVIRPYLQQSGTQTDPFQLLLSEGKNLLKELPATAKRLVSLSKRMEAGQLEVTLNDAQYRRLARETRRQLRFTQVIAVASTLAALISWRRK